MDASDTLETKAHSDIRAIPSCALSQDHDQLGNEDANLHEDDLFFQAALPPHSCRGLKQHCSHRRHQESRATLAPPAFVCSIDLRYQTRPFFECLSQQIPAGCKRPSCHSRRKCRSQLRTCSSQCEANSPECRDQLHKAPSLLSNCA